jgi:IS5 family transposase
LLSSHLFDSLSSTIYTKLDELTLKEVYRQQLELFQKNQQSIEDRIVSLSQPHIRPIVRGKAGKPVELGAKLSASCFEGYIAILIDL